MTYPSGNPAGLSWEQAAAIYAVERDELLASWRRLDVTHRMTLEENERLRAENAELVGAALVNGEQLAEMSSLVGARAEIARLRALVSWIDGALVDEMPWMEIRAQINEFRRAGTGPTTGGDDGV